MKGLLLPFAQQAFTWTWKTSVAAALLIVLVLLAQKVLGRWLTPRLRYVLGLLILVRLVLPLAPPSSLSLENVFTRAGPLAQAPGIVPLITRPTQPSAPGAHPVDPNQRQALTIRDVLGIGWVCGMLALVSATSWRYTRWCRLIRAGKPVPDERLRKLLEAARETMGVRRPVTLVTVPHLSSPAVFGLWRVRLLLPEAALQRLNDREWRLVFLHEMTHVRNHDVLLNVLMMSVQFLHWFNPLVWLGLRRLRADRELVCDAMVVRRLAPDDRCSYAQVLLKLVEAISLGPRTFSTAVPVVRQGSEIKRRILMIQRPREPDRTALLVTVLLTFVLGSLTFTRAREPAAEPAMPVPASKALLLNIDAQGNLRLTYGQNVITAKEFSVNLDTGQVQARGEARLEQAGRLQSADASTYTLKTNRASLERYVTEIEIRFIGPALIKAEDVRGWIHTRIGDPFKQAAVDEDVRELYATGLFYNMRVLNEPADDGRKLIYLLQCRPRLLEVTFSGNSKFSDAELRRAITSKVGGLFNERALFLDQRGIQELYAQAGHRGTEVKAISATDEDRGEAKVTFAITESAE